MLRHDIIYHDLIIVQSRLREIKKKKQNAAQLTDDYLKLRDIGIFNWMRQQFNLKYFK